MEYRTLGRTGLPVSAVGLGAWEIGGAVKLTFEKLGRISHGWGRTDDRASMELIAKCSEAGVNFIDTAPIYGDGHSEEIIGKALKGSRDKWIVCTKGGHGATNGAAWSDFSRQRLLSQMDESLRRLGMDHVDVYLLHGPSAQDIERGECLRALEDLRRAGKTRFVGVSIGPNEMGIGLIRAGAVDVLQQSISIVSSNQARELLAAAKAGNVGIVARGLFGAGFLTGAVNASTTFSDDDRRSWQAQDSKRRMAEMAERLRAFTCPGRNLAQLAVSFVLGLDGVSTVIPGTTKWTHMAENIAALQGPALTREQREAIERMQGA
ncbi:MAG TPA: aldo/keto reductase [Candidatus Brocadiia bacterium]|nr:aldo/keto reductase [Candidatus Brocadiia bacterium]